MPRGRDWYLPPDVRAIRRAQREDEERRPKPDHALHFRIVFWRDMSAGKGIAYDHYSSAETLEEAQREVTPDLIERAKAQGAAGYQIVRRINGQVCLQETFDA